MSNFCTNRDTRFEDSRLQLLLLPTSRASVAAFPDSSSNEILMSVDDENDDSNTEGKEDTMFSKNGRDRPTE